MNNSAYILITIIALAVVGFIFIFRSRKARKPISKLAAVSFSFVIAGIVFGENRLAGYGLIGAGLALAIIDIFIKRQNKIN